MAHSGMIFHYLSGTLRRITSFRAFLALCMSFVWLVTAGNPALADATDTKGTEKKHLLFVGSSTMAPMIETLAKQFRGTHPELEFTIEEKGSGVGVQDTLSGRADIGMVARPLKEDEKALFVIPIARDGAAFVVHKSNPVASLNHAQACDVFSGRINNWKALGGADRPIELLTRAKGQGVTEVVTHYLKLKEEPTTLSKEVWLSEDVVNSVSSHPDTLSILSIGVLTESVRKGSPIKALQINGMKPTPDAIRDGSWPMARSLTLVTRSVPEDAVQEFIQFVLSPENEAVILANDFVPY